MSETVLDQVRPDVTSFLQGHEQRIPESDPELYEHREFCREHRHKEASNTVRTKLRVPGPHWGRPIG